MSDNLRDLARTISEVGGHTFASTATEINAEDDRLINEIAAITQMPPIEVKTFYHNHPYSLEFIKQVALQGGELEKDSIEKTVAEGILPAKFLADLAEDLNKMFPKTWRDYLSDIPYYFAYWFSYPFIWLAFWLWEGMMEAKEEVWD